MNRELFYFIEDERQVVYWATYMPDDRTDLIFIGSSVNPNIRMAVHTFLQNYPRARGWKIQQLPD